MSQINVYKASAGSGKTETLSQQYIKMLLGAGADKEKFSRVLAVTFTNKATAEMKARIVEKLYEISCEKEPQEVAGVKIAPKKAKDLLSAILHGYSNFRVSTIDKFFQVIIRAFVRELNLNASYAIELDDRQVINDTIEDILLKIGEPEYKVFYNWFFHHITDVAEESGDDVKVRTLRKSLEEFATQIFNAKYAAAKSLMPDDATFKAEINKLTARRNAILGVLKGMANAFMDRFAKESFTKEDCAKGSLTPIIKFHSGDDKFPKLNTTIRKWEEKACIAGKSNHKADVEAAYNSWMGSAIMAFVKEVDDVTFEYNTCTLITKNAPYYMLFNELEKEIKRHTKSENTQLLSGSSEFIDKIIDGSDTPFIYEKTGTRIDNYLIDEFQDTSRLQWNNFKPLIEDSYGKGMENLIVGDVKQSIYRFRDSDWSILDKEVGASFSIKHEVLDNNFRSLGNIINFNNDLFKRLADLTQKAYNRLTSGTPDNTITRAYADVVQQIPVPRPGKDDIDVHGAGYVNINFIEDLKGDDYNNEVFSRVLKQIEELQDKGYKLSDIGILYRWKAGAREIAKFLISNGINVISEEALLIASNSAVTDIVALLKYVINHGDAGGSYIVKNFLKLDDVIIETLKPLPLYELVEQVIYLCHLDTDASNVQYLNAFKDLIEDFIARKGSNIKEFLEWWDEVKDNQALSTPSSSDAVNVITLHKSKGLAYKAVILPEINWLFKANTQAKDILWEKIPADATQYSALGCVAVEFCDMMRESIFSKAYLDEVLMQYIDNLNLLYVAFTRAKYVLIGYCGTAKTLDYSNVMTSMFPIFNAGFNNVDGMELEGAPMELEIGEIPDPAKFDKKRGGEELEEMEELKESEEKKESEEVEMSPAKKMELFPLRDKGFKNDGTERGSRMHRIMESVITAADIEPLVEDMMLRGHISKELYEEMVRDLTAYVTNPAVAEWFDGKRRAVSEREIVQVYTGPDGKPARSHWRPDRVLIADDGSVIIIDYKFGEQKSHDHINQVRNYIRLYKEAGHQNVTGYLYYFEGLEVIRIDN